MKKKILSIALFAGITTATYAQGEVNVLYLDGTPHVIAMTDIDKIELTKGSINTSDSAQKKGKNGTIK